MTMSDVRLQMRKAKMWSHVFHQSAHKCAAHVVVTKHHWYVASTDKACNRTPFHASDSDLSHACAGSQLACLASVSISQSSDSVVVKHFLTVWIEIYSSTQFALEKLIVLFCNSRVPIKPSLNAVISNSDQSAQCEKRVKWNQSFKFNFGLIWRLQSSMQSFALCKQIYTHYSAAALWLQLWRLYAFATRAFLLLGRGAASHLWYIQVPAKKLEYWVEQYFNNISEHQHW